MKYITLYDDFFYVLLVSLFVFACIKYLVRKAPSLNLLLFFELILVSLAMISAAWGISGRPSDIEGDTAVYLDFFETMKAGGDNPFSTFEPGFVLLTRLVAMSGLDSRVLFFLVPVLLGLSYHRLASSIFGARSALTVLAFAGLLVYPFFFSLTANVIRQGVAMALVFYTMLKLLDGHPGRARLAAVSGLFFHRSSIILLPWAFLRKTCERIPLWLIILIWMVVSAASYLSVFKTLTILVFEQLSMIGLSVNYSDTENIDYETGFRWSFWLFSSFSIVLLCALRALGYYWDRVGLIFKMSCYFGIVHIITFDLAYNDRFGLYVWMLYPIQLLYLSRCFLIRLTQVMTRNSELPPAHS